MEEPKLENCPGCNAKPGIHQYDCDVQRCSVCGMQALSCRCAGHDPVFSRWTGFWPGDMECKMLGFTNEDGHPDINRLYSSGLYKAFFIKPIIRKFKCKACKQTTPEHKRRPVLKPRNGQTEYICPYCKGKLEEI